VTKAERRPQRILFGLTGGIAAYKVCEAISTLVKAGYEVRAILTAGAEQFITPLTIATLCRHPAYCDRDFWQPVHGRPLHIELGEWADVMAIAPLTANTLGKLAYGLADNLLTNTILASTCPVLLAPAMNTDMWEQPPVQHNWQRLQRWDRFHAIEPGSGLLACDRVGAGRMAEPSQMVDYLRSLLYCQTSPPRQRDLAGKRLLISAGGTREYFDPTRFIGNPATGKMGLALARAAAHRGAIVTLVCGLTELDLTVPGATIATITTAAELETALTQHFPHSDWLIMAAAVADVRPAEYTPYKRPKRDLPTALPLAPVPDLVAGLAASKRADQRVIGFAAQTGDIVTPAREKLIRKGLDAIVANPIDQPGAGFGSDTNQAQWIGADGTVIRLAQTDKLHLAHQILDQVLAIGSGASQC